MSAIKQVWSVFNHWRKRYWLSRVVVLCLLALTAVYGAWLNPWLARISCQAILADGEPKMTDAIYRSNKANEVRRLQAALMAKLDKDEDGTLDAAEAQQAAVLDLDSAQLSAPPLQVDLEQIVAAARRADLVPLSYTAPAIRRSAWRAALAETDEIMAPERKQIAALLVWYRVPDYRKGSTWLAGARTALTTCVSLICGFFGNPFHVVPFFTCLYLISLIASLWFRPGRVRLAVGGLALIAVGLLVLADPVLWAYMRHYGVDGPLLYWPGVHRLGYIALIAAPLLSGARSATRFEKGRKAVGPLLFALGLILVCWGLIPCPKMPLFHGPSDFPYLLGVPINLGWRAAIVSLGVVALVCALAIRLRRKQLTAVGIPAQDG